MDVMLTGLLVLMALLMGWAMRGQSTTIEREAQYSRGIADGYIGGYKAAFEMLKSTIPPKGES